MNAYFCQQISKEIPSTDLFSLLRSKTLTERYPGCLPFSLSPSKPKTINVLVVILDADISCPGDMHIPSWIQESYLQYIVVAITFFRTPSNQLFSQHRFSRAKHASVDKFVNPRIQREISNLLPVLSVDYFVQPTVCVFSFCKNEYKLHVCLLFHKTNRPTVFCRKKCVVFRLRLQ